MAENDGFLTEKDLQEADGYYLGYDHPYLLNVVEIPDRDLDIGVRYGDTSTQDMWRVSPPLR